MHEIDPICGNTDAFLQLIFMKLKQFDLDVSSYELDHICYRTSSAENYLHTKQALAKYASVLAETLINHRPITTFKLLHPIQFQSRKIYYLEVPHPKPNKVTIDGLEHAEFVISESFKDFIERHRHLQFDASGVSKVHSPELELSLGEHLHVKFHHRALHETIRSETLST